MNQLKNLKKEEEGFTLIELLVVVIIAGVLAAIGIPAWQGMRLKTQAAGAKTVIANIKKECQSNRDLGVDEVFTPMTPSGYSVQPQESLSCYGDPGTGLVSAVPNEVNKNPTYFYEHLTGLISESSSRTSNNVTVLTPDVLESSCGLLGSRYGQLWGAISRRNPPSFATDGNPKTFWTCRGNVHMKFDLGEEKIIGSVNIVLPEGGNVEIYVDDQLITDPYVENDPNNQNLFTKIDLGNIKGRYIEYRSYTSYPRHRHTALGELTVDVQ